MLSMPSKSLTDKIKTRPESIAFDEIISFITEYYDYTPTRFTNGAGESLVNNEAGSNEGSCKIFSFAKLNGLSKDETLDCFGDYYRKDVLMHPEGQDHANIRAFIKHGWNGIQSDAEALVAK